MKNPICISTGCVYKLSEDINERIRILRQFNPAGIEISFPYPDHLFNFDISEENLEYLKTLKFKSIHASGHDIIYENNKRTKEVLDRILRLYKQINARNVVFHKNAIKDYGLVANYGFTASLENDDHNKKNNTIDYFKNILDKNKNLKFTFDFAHAISTGSDISEYIEYFKDRLIEIHFSIIMKDSQGQYSSHAFLHKNDSKEVRKLLQSLKKVSAPLVLEAFIPNINDIYLIEKEMDYIKEI